MGFLETLDWGLISLALGGLFVLLIFFLMVGRMLRWIVKVPPNKALLVYGVRTRTKVTVLKRVPAEPGSVSEGGKVKYITKPVEVVVNYKIVKGGWTLIFPVIHSFKELSLSVMTLDVEVENVLSSQAVPITVDGIAQLKIGSDDTFIATAAEQLLDKTDEQVEHVARETLMGHFRAIVGLMTVEQAYKDREEFSRRVQEVAFEDLSGLGLQIVSFVIKNIRDEQGYIDALGQPEIQAKLRDARKAKAEANRDATEKEQGAAKSIAEFTKNTDVAKAVYDAEVATKRAIADRAEAISLAEQDKTLEERKAEAAEQAAFRRDRELDAQTRRPADADLYAKTKEAEGTRAVGFAGADVKAKTGLAEAEADKAKGLAHADVTKAELTAEAEGRTKLVEAYNQYGEPALKLVLGQMFLQGLPTFAGEITKHISEIDEVRIVDLSGGGGDGEKPPVLEQYADQGLRILTKILQGAPAVIGGPLDDIVAALVVKKAKELGITPAEKTEKALEPTTEKVLEEVPPVEAAAVTPPAEEVPPQPQAAEEQPSARKVVRRRRTREE